METIMNLEMPITSTSTLTLKMGNLMSENDFFQFCQMNDTLEFERDSQGNIIIMSPATALTGGFNADILIELGIWNKKHRLGKVFDSSSGFTLINGAVRSPDISWIRNDRWKKLPDSEKNKFTAICPDFIIEIRSKSDDLSYLTDKMQEYLNNGAQLGWLIDSIAGKVYVYKQDVPVMVYDSLFVELSDEEILPGFKLDLGSIIEN